ncbi:hypothetical protein K7X08_027840 [Anisodus acutangulus]|uniref:Uncharacterized protein n=1 Tax=Anisodus acutangulus TaxID=402998 RepID=A0A9Q1MZM4_9SOLA|nr:hypothetical protein K7X08_027840 [Anisodus acutangulus]
MLGRKTDLMMVLVTSLTVSMSGWNHGMDDDNEHAQVSIGNSDEVLRSQWLNPVSWMSSTAPGGPLAAATALVPARMVATGSTSSGDHVILAAYKMVKACDVHLDCLSKRI